MKKRWYMISLAALLIAAAPAQAKAFEAPDTITVYCREFDTITLDDFCLMARCVQAEAGADHYDAMYACAEVICNRVESDLFPGTVEEVIAEEGQFAVWDSGAIWLTEPGDAAMEAVQAALEEQTLPDDVMYFCSDGYHVNDYVEPYDKIDNMFFSRQKAGTE